VHYKHLYIYRYHDMSSSSCYHDLSAMPTHSNHSGSLPAEYAGIIVCEDVDWQYPFFSKRPPDQPSVNAHGHPLPSRSNEGGILSNDALTRRRDAEPSPASSVPPVINMNLSLPSDSQIIYFPEYAIPFRRPFVFTLCGFNGVSLWRRLRKQTLSTTRCPAQSIPNPTR